MSPQLSAVVPAASASLCRDVCPSASSLVSSSSSSDCLNTIIQAADEAYRSAHVRLDTAVRSDADLPNLCTVVAAASGPRFALRKRKVSVTAAPSTYSCEPRSTSGKKALGSALLSGLFSDLNNSSSTEEHYITSDEGDSCPSTPVPQRKKARLSRCTKSYVSFAHLGCSTQASTRSYVEKSCDPNACKTNPKAATTTSKSTGGVDSAVLAESLQAAKDLADVIFPHLPATVSNSDNHSKASSSSSAAAPFACVSTAPSTSPSYSADLSSQAVAVGQHVPASEDNPPSIEPESSTIVGEQEHVETELTLDDLYAFQSEDKAKASSAAEQALEAEANLVSASGADSYGWFLPLDDEADHDAVNPYESESGSSSSNATLAFQASVSNKAGCADHEAEVEWAKAADTIDDVLGDFF